ncbi:hypothetical protein TEHAL1_22840 [Tetragenococcus halophilus]|nr:hypothetical protein TEHAL1_22840 [Tetragenococcus halophilus]
MSNTWGTYLSAGDNTWKQVLIPHMAFFHLKESSKALYSVTDGWSRGALASW